MLSSSDSVSIGRVGRVCGRPWTGWPGSGRRSPDARSTSQKPITLGSCWAKSSTSPSRLSVPLAGTRDVPADGLHADLCAAKEATQGVEGDHRLPGAARADRAVPAGRHVEVGPRPALDVAVEAAVGRLDVPAGADLVGARPVEERDRAEARRARQRGRLGLGQRVVGEVGDEGIELGGRVVVVVHHRVDVVQGERDTVEAAAHDADGDPTVVPAAGHRDRDARATGEVAAQVARVRCRVGPAG